MAIRARRGRLVDRCRSSVVGSALKEFVLVLRVSMTSFRQRPTSMFMSQANVNSPVDCNRLVGQYFITNAEGLEEGN